MPTTYTSLLGLSLPATGELAGTWGTEVNNGITSLLDAAIAGTTTLSTDANVTLTTVTGAANQARQQILLCTGARTAQRTITAPAQSKTYVVINATTGGFAVQLVGAGPTAGVSIAAGERVVAAWNGSDFVKVASNLVTGTATRIPFFDASGLLSNAADLVRDSSGNVGIGTTTPRVPGGGAIGLTLNGSTTGFVDVNTNGTRVLTLSGFGNDAFVTNPTAAGVLILQTNNTERVRIDSAGNVGIGTASPGARLTVAVNTATAGFEQSYSITNTVDSNLFLRVSGSANTDKRATIGPATSTALVFNTADTERMRIDSAGNVGIGRTPTGSAVVDVQSAAAGILRIRGGTGANQGSSVYGTVGSDTTTWAIGSRATIYGGTPGNDTAVYTLGTLSLGTAGTPDRLLIDGSGNVGIGVAPTLGALEVRTAGGTPTLALANSGTRYGFLQWNNAIDALRMGVDGAFSLVFATQALERMRITSTGNIVAGASAALATTATDGFLYVPTCAGTPTGTPTAITGMAPIVVNTTNNKLYFYSGGAWRDAGP